MRQNLYLPEFGQSGGPPEDSLLPLRTTTLNFPVSGETQVKTDSWLDKASQHKRFRAKWTGKTVFLSKARASKDGDLVDPTSGEIIAPDSVEAISVTLKTMREELKAAQQKDPKLVQVFGVLSKKKLGEFISDALGPSPEVHRAKARACHFKVASDGVLLGKLENKEIYLPVVPDTPYVSLGPNKGPANMTWKHLLLGTVHNTRAAAHLSSADMCSELSRLVFWWPPEHLRRDCDTWVDRCRHCVATYRKPKYTPTNKSVLSFRPGHRVQFDLMEIKPVGEEGETHILTAVCVSTRYAFFRTCRGRDQVDIAAKLFDIMMDAGVVPSIMHSDNEFISLAIHELTSLMGSSQLFSTALRPQSLGVDERSHRDIRNGLRVMVDAFVRANPRNWTQFTRYLESKSRHRVNPATGISPYQAWHGFSGSTPLASALRAFEEIPEGLVHTEWLKGIREEADKIEATLSEHWVADAAARTRKLKETTTPPPFNNGDLVMVSKPFYERGTGMLLPQADGPYLIDQVLDSHLCTLKDAINGDPYMKGQRISLSRLIRFKYPVSCVGIESVDPPVGLKLVDLKVNDFVAIELRTGPKPQVHVARIVQTFQANGYANVEVWSVSPSDRFGPWNRRQWSVLTGEHGARYEVIPECEILTKVDLEDGALSSASLERLALLGVPISGPIKHDSAIPGRPLR